MVLVKNSADSYVRTGAPSIYVLLESLGKNGANKLICLAKTTLSELQNSICLCNCHVDLVSMEAVLKRSYWGDMEPWSYWSSL